MTRLSQNAASGYALADAQHILKSAEKHWPALQAIGATEAERKRFVQSIAEGTRVATGQGAGPVALETARQTLSDFVGDFRSGARLVARGIDGRDAKAEQALRVKGGFPKTDLRLSGYVSGLAARMRPYSAKLATRGFSKDKQAQIVVAATAFKDAFAARGKERGDARAQTLARESVFRTLRTETSYFRTLGHEALRNVIARADFDRVALPGKAVAAPPAKAVAAPPAKAVVTLAQAAAPAAAMSNA